ncbi:MAG: PH domain-containing protein [Acidimicrobiaceae bacterium]|nr:PH domain-containing protein [Acidimicrobiaceae bacterium]
MAKSLILRDNEVRIISVTPVAWGILRPLLLGVIGLVLVVIGSMHVHLLHRLLWWLVAVVVAPFALVTLTRIWRWRSHKIHVTTQRVLLEGGVLGHQKTMVELRDVVATRVDQSLLERITRRGMVSLETSGGPILIGRVRHPSALCRIIDAERSEQRQPPLALDTVFTYEEPSVDQFEIRPVRRRRRDHWA